MDCKEDINELLARYFAKEELTGAQQQVLDEWISANREEFERMQRVVEAPVKKPEPAEFNAEAAWEKVESRLENKSFWLGIRSHIGMMISAAACVLFVVALATGILSAQPGGRIYGICQLGHEAETSVAARQFGSGALSACHGEVHTGG